jgi:hypothetical protein
MISLLSLSSIVYSLTLLRKRISVASRWVIGMKVWNKCKKIVRWNGTLHTDHARKRYKSKHLGHLLDANSQLKVRDLAITLTEPITQ